MPTPRLQIAMVFWKGSGIGDDLGGCGAQQSVAGTTFRTSFPEELGSLAHLIRAKESRDAGSMHPDDEKLVLACKRGDRDAQRRLFDASHSQIYRLMVRMVGNQDAPDVTQQVYLQVYRKVGQFSGRSRLNTWVYRLAVNEALQHLRRKSRHPVTSLEYEPAGRDESHERRSDLAEALDVALASVDEELKTIFLLREVEELPYNTIAEILDIPEGTVGSRLNRARKELQSRLMQVGWSP